MKNLLITSLFFLSASLLPGQDMVVNYFGNNQITFHDNYYTNNLDGLTNLMSDLSIDDPSLYEIMNPKLQEFYKKNRQANTIVFAGYGSTLALWSVAAASQFSDRDKVFSKNTQSISLISLGALIGISTTALFYKKRVNKQDILNFVNQFNKQSKDGELEFSFRPDINLSASTSAGFSFSLKF